jgi:hypothetical protein
VGSRLLYHSRPALSNVQSKFSCFPSPSTFARCRLIVHNHVCSCRYGFVVPTLSCPSFQSRRTSPDEQGFDPVHLQSISIAMSNPPSCPQWPSRSSNGHYFVSNGHHVVSNTCPCSRTVQIAVECAIERNVAAGKAVEFGWNLTTRACFGDAETRHRPSIPSRGRLCSRYLKGPPTSYLWEQLSFQFFGR